MSSSHGWMLNVAVYLWLFYSFYVSEENESDVWNNISLINESNDENDWQFSNNPCQTSSKSTQDYGLPFVPSRMPQVLSRSPAPSSGLSSPNRPIVMKESILWKYKAFSSMWALVQLTQMVFFRFVQWKGIRSLGITDN